LIVLYPYLDIIQYGRAHYYIALQIFNSQSYVTNVQDFSFYKNNPTPTWIIPFSLHSTHIELAERQHVWIYLQGLYVVLLRFCKRIIATFFYEDQKIAITLTTNWLTDWRQTPLSIALSFKLTTATNTVVKNKTRLFHSPRPPASFHSILVVIVIASSLTCCTLTLTGKTVTQIVFTLSLFYHLVRFQM
jgi:hypothetical protein